MFHPLLGGLYGKAVRRHRWCGNVAVLDAARRRGVGEACWRAVSLALGSAATGLPAGAVRRPAAHATARSRCAVAAARGRAPRLPGRVFAHGQDS